MAPRPRTFINAILLYYISTAGTVFGVVIIATIVTRGKLGKGLLIFAVQLLAVLFAYYVLNKGNETNQTGLTVSRMPVKRFIIGVATGIIVLVILAFIASAGLS